MAHQTSPETQKAIALVNVSHTPSHPQPHLTPPQPGQNYTFSQTTLPIPTPGPQEILIRLSCTGICGTDIGLATTILGACHASHILGHEGIGTIVSLGSAVTSTIKPGQRVGVGWIRASCKSCPACVSGRGETYCATKTYSGVHVPGTLAQYILVPEGYLTLLSDDIAPEVQAPIMCAGVTAYKALKTADVVPGSWVLISGAAGGVGSLAVQYARAMGYRVIGVDGGSERKAYCLESGAEAYIDFQEERDVKGVVARLTDGKLCAAALVCIGVPQAYETALECIGDFGTLVCVGIPGPEGKISLHPLKLINSGISVVGSLVGGRGDIAEAMEFVRRGAVKPKVVCVGMDKLDEYARKIPELGAKLVIKLE